ncbi:GDP-mannose 4,6-dehydratase, partial [Sulfurovum sp.]|uniref:GDP-mannose 4,6-dehydratase n=1 Tax=Sulfurovum sp. TaxID=1969726 RepID=UPI0025FB5E78
MTAFEQLPEKLKTDQNTWLVTGNAGFIGSNLTEFLLNHNQKVVGLDNFSTGYQHNIDDVLASVGEDNAKNFTFIEGDIADMQTC